jgi:uncharacterized protein YbjQ (UPF0145 family)
MRPQRLPLLKYLQVVSYFDNSYLNTGCHSCSLQPHLILKENESRNTSAIVTGEAVLGANLFRDLFAGLRDIVGGRSGAYEKELRKARDLAFEKIIEAARELGANAVVGVDIDYEVLGVRRESARME